MLNYKKEQEQQVTLATQLDHIFIRHTILKSKNNTLLTTLDYTALSTTDVLTWTWQKAMYQSTYIEPIVLTEALNETSFRLYSKTAPSTAAQHLQQVKMPMYKINVHKSRRRV